MSIDRRRSGEAILYFLPYAATAAAAAAAAASEYVSDDD